MLQFLWLNIITDVLLAMDGRFMPYMSCSTAANHLATGQV
jgi:hypothetical protein